MLDMPKIRIELEGISRTVQHMFATHNDELNTIICEKLDKTLNKDWVKNIIGEEVEKLVRKSVPNIRNNYQLRDAIENLVADNLTKLIDGKE